MSDASPKPDVPTEIEDVERTRASIAEAIARRAVSAQPDDDEERRFALERDTRQDFRRLLDPGIARGASTATMEATLKVRACSTPSGQT